jgi:hypothetical protein
MSRLLVAASTLSASLVSVQPVSSGDIAEQIEKARRLVAVDAVGCIKYPQTNEIVVCGENPDSKSQRIFTDRSLPDENRIRPGEAVSQLRAACCSPIPKVPPFWTSSFGYVPPPAIPLEEAMKGLPEPEMIVTNGDNAPP